jgi:hypothetical protein
MGRPERAGGLQIDDEIERRWLVDRQFARPGALENPVHGRRHPLRGLATA